MRPPLHPVYQGVQASLPSKWLPNYKEVGLAVEEAKKSDGDPFKVVSNQIINVYQKASIPTIHYISIYKKVQKLDDMKKRREAEMVLTREGEHLLYRENLGEKQRMGK